MKEAKGHVARDSIDMKYPDQANPEIAGGWVPRAGGRGEGGVTVNRYRVAFWGTKMSGSR